MKKLDDNTYRQALKSVNQAFDSEGLWNSIEKKMDKKPQRRFLFFIPFGTFLGLVALALVWLLAPKKSTDQKNLFLKETSFADIPQTPQQKNSDKGLIIQKLQKEPRTYTLQESLKTITTTKSPSTKNRLAKTTTTKTKTSLISYNNQNQAKTSGLFVDQKTKDLTTKGFSILKPIPRINQQIFSNEKRALKKPEEIKDYLIAPPSNEKGKPRPRSLLLSLSAGSPISDYKGITEIGNSWAAQSREANTDLYHVQINLAYGFDITKNLRLITGISLSRMTERFKGVVENLSEETIETDTAVFITTTEGLDQYYFGEQTKFTNTTTTVQHYNHYYAIGVTVGGRYTGNLNDRYRFFAEANINYNPFHLGRGRTYSMNGDFESLGAIASNDLLQVRTTLGLEYHVTKQISYQFGLQWNKDLTSRISSVNASITKQVFSINAGLIYKFNK